MSGDPVKPNFLLVGAARSGTTALARTLDQHPDVFLTDPKEVHFFAHANNPVRYTAPGDDETINRYLVSDPAEYYDLYEGARNFQARGEGSVSTLYGVEKSIPAIEQYAASDVKILAILREPAARAYSSFLYLRGRGFEAEESFERALALEESRKSEGFHHMWHLRGMSRYAEQVPQFAAAFGERFKLIIAEEYKEAPDRTLREVSDFLGVEPGFEFRTDMDTNRGGEPKSKLLTRAISEVRRFGPARDFVKAVTSDSLRERVRGANLQRPDGGVALDRLRDEFEPDRRCVEGVLGRPIPLWSAE